MAAEELKIIITFKAGKASVGIKKPEADPFLRLVEGSIEEISAQVPALVEEARTQWAESLKYPKCETTITQPKPAQTSTRTTGKAKEKEDATRPKLF